MVIETINNDVMVLSDKGEKVEEQKIEFQISGAILFKQVAEDIYVANFSAEKKRYIEYDAYGMHNVGEQTVIDGFKAILAINIG
jgi:hypothetical protein